MSIKFSMLLALCLLVSFVLIVAGKSMRQQRDFRVIEGPSLSEKLAAAVKRAGADSPQSPFWTGYAFKLRPGAAVDTEIREFSGQVEDFAGLRILFGTGNGRPVETRNPAIFILHQPGGRAATRIEIYNLDRPHGFDGYPVYWLGRVGSKESLDYLRPLVEANQSDAIAVRATAAIGLHDDPSVRASLKDLILTVSTIKVRRAAIKGLGHIKGEALFLADVVSKERDLETRINAVQAIGYSNDAKAMAVLQSLYSSLDIKDIRKSLIDAASVNEEQAAVAAFLLRIARQDDSPELCAYATRRLSERAAHHLLQTVNEKVDINKLDFQTQFEMEKVRAASQGKPKDEAMQMLINLARTHPQVGPRVMAIISLGRFNEPQALDFFQELLGK